MQSGNLQACTHCGQTGDHLQPERARRVDCDRTHERGHTQGLHLNFVSAEETLLSRLLSLMATTSHACSGQCLEHFTATFEQKREG